ncbi:MAG: hypothetical protein H0U21_12285 [Acidimicrobiia bacterium]|nr:hypothetical protein [Acidimicrobiia bacterium]
MHARHASTTTDHKVVATTKTEARKRLDALVREADAGNAPADGNATLSLAIDVWERRVLAAKDLAPSTRSVYRWCAATWRAELGTARLRTLRVEDVERVLDRLASGHHAGRPAARETLVKMRSVLGQVLNAALRRGIATRTWRRPRS